MALFWIVAKKPDSVFIAEETHVVAARLRASLGGQGGEFVEAHQLDAKTARKVKGYVGKVLTLKEAARLLKAIR